MSKKSFKLYHDTLSILDEMSNEERGELFYAIYKYQLGEEIEMSKIIKFAFHAFKHQFDRDNEAYNKVCEKNKRIAEERWDTKSTKRTKEVPEDTKSTDTDTDTDTHTDTDTDTDTDTHTDKKLTLFDNFIEMLYEYFKERRILVFKNKINKFIAQREFDNKFDAVELANLYSAYVMRNKSKAVRLDKWLIAYREGSLSDIEYGKEEKGAGTYDEVDAYFAKKQEVVDVEVLG